MSFFHSFIPFKFSSTVLYNSVRHASACRNASDFKFPRTLVEEVDYQIYISSKFNIWKNTFWLINRFSLENLGDFLWNAPNLPIFYFECSTHGHGCRQGRPTFSKVSYQSSLCLCVWVCMRGGGVNKSMKFFHFLGHIFLTIPLYLHTESFSLGTEEEIRKLYFDDKNWKNNMGHVHVEIRVLNKSFSKDRFWTVHSLSMQLIELVKAGLEKWS